MASTVISTEEERARLEYLVPGLAEPSATLCFAYPRDAGATGWDTYNNFHAACDGAVSAVHPSALVVRGNGGRVFGGYTRYSWAVGSATNDAEAFLFSVDNVGKLPSKPPGHHAIQTSQPNRGAVFGHLELAAGPNQGCSAYPITQAACPPPLMGKFVCQPGNSYQCYPCTGGHPWYGLYVGEQICDATFRASQGWPSMVHMASGTDSISDCRAWLCGQWDGFPDFRSPNDVRFPQDATWEMWLVPGQIPSGR